MKRLLVACSATAALLAVSGVSYALKAMGEPQAMIQNEERSACRAMFFSQDDQSFTINGQFNLDYSAPVWKPEYQEAMDAVSEGKRIRLGKNFWARFESDVDSTIGGAALKAGEYYLCASRAKAGWSIIALDAAEIRKLKLDAYQSEETTGGVEIPMTYTKEERESDELMMRFAQDKQAGTTSFELQFGPHKLTAGVVPKF